MYKDQKAIGGVVSGRPAPPKIKKKMEKKQKGNKLTSLRSLWPPTDLLQLLLSLT